MPAFLFYTRFHAAIAAGTKTQTIRLDRGRIPLPGDPLFLRRWTDRAYRSRQAVLLDAVCLSVAPVFINDAGGRFYVQVAGVVLRPDALDAFCKADGFADSTDMHRYYSEKRMFPFEGIVIRLAPLSKGGALAC